MNKEKACLTCRYWKPGESEQITFSTHGECKGNKVFRRLSATTKATVFCEDWARHEEKELKEQVTDKWADADDVVDYVETLRRKDYKEMWYELEDWLMDNEKLVYDLDGQGIVYFDAYELKTKMMELYTEEWI